MSFTRLKCTKCKKNFILKEDFYQFYFDPKSKNYLDHLYYYLTFESQKQNLMRKSFCKIAEISNCAHLLNSKECLKCDDGYILTVVNIDFKK